MRKIVLILLVLTVIIVSISPGCVQPPAGTPAPTPPTATAIQTIVPTTTATPVPTPALTVTPAPAPKRSPVMYYVWIDSDYGFSEVRATIGGTPLNLPPDFKVLNFTINVGDTVRWINDDSYEFPITVVSNEGLWDNRTAYLRWRFASFDYTFNKTGTYTFSIREYPRVRNQIITVNP